jgi:FOG: LysM repeat
MKLSPMKYKNYTWPYNPRSYEITYERNLASHKVPFGTYILQNTGRSNRVMRGAGEFAGAGAYEEFKKLATVFYDDNPGPLIHPVWQASNVYFSKLGLGMEPREDYVSYYFEFWECFDGYEAGMLAFVAKDERESAPDESKELWYTAVYGDTMWGIANRNAMTLDALMGLNPQVKNPNILYVGDILRVG